MIILVTNRSMGISNVQRWWQWREAGQVIKLGWERMQGSYKGIGTHHIYTHTYTGCVFTWEMAFWAAQSPGTTLRGLLCWAGGRWRTPPSDLSTPFALTSMSLWDISDPNTATIKSRLTFENKQEYHTRWDAWKLPAVFCCFGQFLLWLTVSLGNCTLPSHSCDWL